MPRTRYENVSPWEVVRRVQVHTPTGVAATLIEETCDIRETGRSWVYSQGRHRVRVEAPGTGWPRAKTFTGESAWSAAQRHIWDLTSSIERGSW